MRRRALRSVAFDASVACWPAACKPTFELAAVALPVAAGPESATPAAMTAAPIHRFMAVFPFFLQDRSPRNDGPALRACLDLTHVAPDITSGASDDDASGDDPNGGGASDGASALRWSSPWCHPEPRRRRRDWPATGPGRVRRERSA